MELNFKAGVAFTGSISAGGDKAAVRFRVKLLADGTLQLKFHRLRLSQKTVWISHHWHRKTAQVAYFKLEGRSTAGVELQSDRLYFNSLGDRTTAYGTTMGFKGGCQTATLTRKVVDTGKAIDYRLKGFEGFRTVSTECALGRLSMGGVTPLPKDGKLSGRLHLALSAGAELTAWKSEAEGLLRHVVQIMSFAGAGPVKVPIEESWAAGLWTLEYREQSSTRPTGQNVCHPLDLQGIFERAVAAYFDPPIVVKKLGFAIDWFTMTASHTEVRLVAAMTALENLLDANLEQADRFILQAKRFDAVAKALRQTLRDALATDLGPAEIGALYPKILDLNRRSLDDKLRMLLERWGVPMAGITAAEITAAIRARNFVVHRGHYYEDGPPPSVEERDLWEHVILIRELVARIVLTALAYEGAYITFRGGYRLTSFPPVAEVTADSVAGAEFT